MSGETRAAAQGRWHAILPALGVDRKFLTNRHGPCPVCGGKDRFRFDDKDGDGTYYCNQCGAGNGITLLLKLHGWNYRTACDEVDSVLGIVPAKVSRCDTSSDNRESRLAKIERVIAGATDLNIVGEYLRKRGLTIVPTILLGHKQLPYAHNGKFLGYHPAMVAPIVGPDGELQSVHRTYLADFPTRKKTCPPVDTINGAAVRLFHPTDVLGVAEGVETAIAAFELSKIPTWAALTANGIETFEPPDGIKRLIIFGDNDANYRGQKAAYTLANRIAGDQERQISVEVAIPLAGGMDWLDVLLAKRGA